MTEEWRTIPNYPAYEVSDQGRVRRLLPAKGAQPGRILKPKHKRGDNHLYMDLQTHNIVTRTAVARLMALAFKGPPPTARHQAAHWNGVHDDNDLPNIRWATAHENALDKHRHGTDRRGEKHPLCKLPETAIPVIRKRRQSGEIFTAIAADYPVSEATVRDICKRRRWGHVF